MLLVPVAILLAAAKQPTPMPEQGELRCGPMNAYFKLAPGATATEKFKVTNLTRRAIHVSVYHSDAWHDAEGRRTFPESGTAPRGLGKWLSQPQTGHLRIAGSSEAVIDQAVNVPAGALPGTHLGAVMVRMESYEDDSGKEESADHISSGVKVSSVIAMLVHVDVRLPNGELPAPELAIAEQEVQPPTESRPLLVKLRLLNKSDWEVKPSGTLAVFDAGGQPAGKAAFDSFAVWPGQLTWLSAAFAQELQPGKYHALAAFSLQDPGDEQVTYPAPSIKLKVDFEVKASRVVPPSPRAPEPARATGKAIKQGT